MAGVFPTAGSPTSSTSPLPPPSSGIGDFPSLTLSNEFIKLRFFEPDAPRAINQRWLGMPRGVYLGFEPATTPGSKVLTLNVDPVQNFSLAKVPTSSDRVMVDLFTADAVELDFTAHSVWPVYVIASSTYDDRSPTQGKIFTRGAPANDVDEITICKVDYVGGALTTDSAIPINFNSPIAFQNQPYGYMPESAVESLEAMNDTVVEVVAARNSSFTGSHGALATRIDADIEGSSIADRLGLRFVNVISNLHLDKSGSSFNVSSSFTETGREFGPNLTIDGNGSETVEGALTDGTRNFCFVIDGETGHRIISDTTDEPVFGQLSYVALNLGGGKELQFVNASVDVSGNGTNPFVAPVEEGDLVLGADGLYYEIETILDPDNAVLGSAFRGADASQFSLQIRRWTLFLFTVTGGPFSLPVSTTVRFLFPCFFRADRAIFDGSLLIKQGGERPPLSQASDSEAGKATLAIADGLVGSVRTIKSGGIPIANDVHTLNFIYGGASPSPFLPGVVDVIVQGAQGAQGAPSNTGGPGLAGPAGFGYSTNNPFEVDAGKETTPTNVGPPGIREESFIFDWTTGAPAFANLTPDRSYAHVNGGWSKINGIGGHERIRIMDIGFASLTESVITFRVEPSPWTSSTTVNCFMGASQ